jgi:DNA-binding MarR family transcriptional regulator
MTDIDDLDIWQGSNAAPWARQAADRWALLAERVAHLFIALFALSPLPRTETEILIILWRNPEEGEAAILADKLHVSRQTMTGILDKLETGGYALRVPHETDRRRKVIRLTDKGREIVRSFVGSMFRREGALFERHPEVNIDTTLDELDRMLSLEEAWMKEYPLQGESKNGVEEES